jgi:hypothetical protein
LAFNTTEPPWHSDVELAGVIVAVGNALMLTVIVVLVPHCPAAGVNVYVVVAVLLIAGDHVPEIPLVEVVGKAGMVAPEQYGPTCVNVVFKIGLTVTTT